MRGFAQIQINRALYFDRVVNYWNYLNCGINCNIPNEINTSFQNGSFESPHIVSVKRNFKVDQTV